MAADESYAATGEVRFAVVLYGGVSLCIYMNGIVQELLSLVRATAPKVGTTDELHVTELTGAEPVYRELGRRLNQATVGPDVAGPVLTRFVVDLITGTSAGGINGVVLAKALANDQKMDALSGLWVDEGDIAKLINDRHAADDLGGLPLERPPKSLLSGQRMLFRLAQAMRRVSASEPAASPSPYADAIDLWVTTTDLRGRSERVDLADPDKRGAQFELEYRTTFHFMYEHDDVGGGVPSMFAEEYDPLLAFAARCTSSFPAAFEPTQLTDMAPVLTHMQQPNAGGAPPPPAWDTSSAPVRSLFQKYGETPDHYEHVCFADGGYLDNQPVDLVLNTLPKRRATLPVSRRVLIVDPDPGAEPSPDASRDTDRLDLAATLLKVISLPRQEAIRDNVGRIRALREPASVRAAIYAQVDAALAASASPKVDSSSPTSIAYRELRQLQRIRDVASALARVGYADRAYDDDSPQYQRMMMLLTFWKANFGAAFSAALDAVDLDFELRRINFLQRAIDEDMRGDGIARADARFAEGVQLRRDLNAQYQLLARAGRRVRYRVDNPADAELSVLRAKLIELNRFVDDGNPDSSDDRIIRFWATGGVLDAVAAVVARFNTEILLAVTQADRAITDLLRDLPNYQRRWAQFEVYDEATYALQELLPGENKDIEVHRVSPRDASALVDERKTGVAKLAGAQVHHFGAFFDADWRRNDILWGRLDAAERIIVAVWPEGGSRRDRDELVSKAQRAIIRDALTDKEYRRLLARLLAEGVTLPPEPPAGPVPDSEVEAVFLGFKSRYKPPPPPDRKSTLRLASRAARVTGSVAGGLSRDKSNGFGLRWAGRALRVVAGVLGIVIRALRIMNVFRRKKAPVGSPAGPHRES